MATLRMVNWMGSLLVASAVAQVAAAQAAPLASYDGQLPEVGFGTVLAGAGDVNGDGTPDVIVGAPQSLGWRGAARVVSGADGSTLYAYENPKPAGKSLDLYGDAVTGCGDLDGDGLAEFAVGQPIVGATLVGGRVRVYRGSDGSVLREFIGSDAADSLGTALANTGDIDGDGVDDLAVSASGSDVQGLDAGAVFVHSGATGAVLVTYGGEPGTGDVGGYGFALACAGDTNLDGVPDLIIGAPYHEHLSSDQGSFWVRSGFSGQFLMSGLGDTKDLLGSALAGGLDVNGSGSPDVLVGAPEFDGLDAYGGGYAKLYEGSTGAVIGEWHGLGPGETGASVALADVDLDGYADVLVGAPRWFTSMGRVDVYSGDGYGLLAEVEGAAAFDGLGRSLAAVGDLDGDLASEWAVGVPSPETAIYGQVQIFASTSAWHDEGFALAGAAEPRATAMGSLLAGSPLKVRLLDGPPSAAATLVIGSSALLVPFKGGVLVPAVDALVPVPLDVDGALLLAGTWPSNLPSGFQFWLQFWMPDGGAPAGFAASNGLSATAP